MNKLLILVGCGALVAACGGGGGAAPGPETPEQPAASAADAPAAAAANTTVPATFEEQVALGGELYGQKCAECHGASGEGAKAPRVVGLKEGALPLDPPADRQHRKQQFKTVGDVAQFVVSTMPPDAPGSLTEEQYLAILAFDLKANGITLPNKLDLATANSLEIPR
jgi:S-disulfanyl-L-cysteine oxidoreductase SoxD